MISHVLTFLVSSADWAGCVWLYTQGYHIVHPPCLSYDNGIASAGLWSQIKRAPKAKQVRKTFEVAGPARSDALPLDERARQLFAYFKKYNYEVMETGETIRFAGTYKASRGQAAALIFYVFCGKSVCLHWPGRPPCCLNLSV